MPELAVSAGQQDAGLGHVGVPVVLRNIGTRTCHVTGYPGVAGLDGSGRQVAQAQRTLSGYLGGLAGGGAPPVVRLAPGQSAAALVEDLSTPQGGAASCPTYAALLVTLPDQTRSHTLAVSVPACGTLAVHPVLPGTTGTSP